ncbi:MAG: DUF5723 family protein [Bacteroidales bacterium]
MGKTTLGSKLILGGSFLLLLAFPARSQMNNTLYFMYGVPQSTLVNPAKQPQCNLVLGMPVLSPARFDVSPGLSYGDVILPHPTEDSLMTFLHPLADQDAFLEKLDPLNVFQTEVSVSLASLGFRTPIGYFTLGVNTRIESQVYYPRDLFRIPIEGLAEGDVMDLSGLGVDLVAFDEATFGWSLPLGDKFQFGFRAKALFGVASFATKQSELELSGGLDAVSLQADMQFQASLPFGELGYDADGLVESFVLDEGLNPFDPRVLPRYLFNFNNLGAALDLGMTYRPVEKLELSLSVLDIGGITWRDEIQELSYHMDYRFEGAELNPFRMNEGGFGEYTDSVFSIFGDTLITGLESGPGVSYGQSLHPKLYAGVGFYLTPKINFGLLSRTDFLRGTVKQQFTASANVTTGRFLNLTMSYSVIDNTYKNMGAGLSLHLGTFNVYAVTNNGLSAVFWPAETRSVNLWLGFNLVFGCQGMKKAEKLDLPLIY